MGLLDNILNTVNEGIGKAMEKVDAAAQEANAKAEAEGKVLTEEEKEKQAQAMEALKAFSLLGLITSLNILPSAKYYWIFCIIYYILPS